MATTMHNFEMNNFGDNAVSSDDEIDYESENEDTNVACEENHECGKLVKIITDIYIAKCNTENGRKEYSGFDITYRRYLGHFFAWLGTHKRKYGKCIVECHSKNIHWSKLDLIVEDAVVDFFNIVVVGLSTSGKTAEKHKHTIQKHIDMVESKPIVLNNNTRIKLALKTQKERRKLSIVSSRHAIDAHKNIPLKCLSINNENKLLNVAWNYSQFGLSLHESLIFLSFWNTCTSTYLRFDSLHSTCFEDMCYHEEEGPNHLKTESYLQNTTGSRFF